MNLIKIIDFSGLFGAEPINFTQLSSIEKGSADLIVYAIPVMVFFTLLEIWYSWYTNRKSYNAKEALGSLFVGIGNVVVNLLLKVALIYGSINIYNFVPWRMSLSWWTILPCIIIFDFCSYWAHRISHSNRFFWATHVVHHTAEHYNLTVSFRLSWIQHFKLLFFLPIAFCGFHPVIFFVSNQIMVLFQFWQHTEYIGKLHRAIEWLIVTPSNHRVHHGSDEKYLDKNFGVLFTVWDRMFGSYQPEEEKPTYGVTNKIDVSINPFYLNFHEFADIIKDVKNAKSFKKKLFYIFGSPSAVANEKKNFNLQESV